VTNARLILNDKPISHARVTACQRVICLGSPHLLRHQTVFISIHLYHLLSLSISLSMTRRGLAPHAVLSLPPLFGPSFFRAARLFPERMSAGSHCIHDWDLWRGPSFIKILFKFRTSRRRASERTRESPALVLVITPPIKDLPPPSARTYGVP
jgi:hypothetical protein